jgi:hypothetical protein
LWAEETYLRVRDVIPFYLDSGDTPFLVVDVPTNHTFTNYIRGRRESLDLDITLLVGDKIVSTRRDTYGCSCVNNEGNIHRRAKIGWQSTRLQKCAHTIVLLSLAKWKGNISLAIERDAEKKLDNLGRIMATDEGIHQNIEQIITRLDVVGRTDGRILASILHVVVDPVVHVPKEVAVGRWLRGWASWMEDIRGRSSSLHFGVNSPDVTSKTPVESRIVSCATVLVRIAQIQLSTIGRPFWGRCDET